MELGFHTMELENIRRLTPAVFRSERKSDWSVTYNANFPSSNATEANAKYCLDRAVSINLKKQEHAGVKREPAKNVPFVPPPIYIDRVLFEKPSTQSNPVHVVAMGFSYTIHRIVGGFDPSERFYELWAESEEQSDATLLGGPTTRGICRYCRKMTPKRRLLTGGVGYVGDAATAPLCNAPQAASGEPCRRVIPATKNPCSWIALRSKCLPGFVGRIRGRARRRIAVEDQGLRHVVTVR
jgi:hypothetical protein